MMEKDEITPHLFRTEYSKIVAVLFKTFRLKNIGIAEDIASDTFLKAAEQWPVHGLPENPTAWLYTVAKNKTKDYFKHLSVTENKNAAETESNFFEQDFKFDPETIEDSQLAMIFTVCNPANRPESQIALALQILCGFSVEEIGAAFLTKPETIKKRLLRARANLRNDDFQIKDLTASEITTRATIVLKTLYLLFNEGYSSKTNDQQIRKELCSEAIRLALVLVESPLTNTPETNALMALMCFQSSRLDARINNKGEAILFSDQDKSLWDESLIQRGNYYLINAAKGNIISKYHLEAGIAYWHTTPGNENKWKHILELYNQLIIIEFSPVTALNRTFAFAKVYGHKKAIKEVEKLNMVDSNQFHGLLGYLYKTIDRNKAISHYEEAIRLSKSRTEKQILKKQIDQLE